MNGFVESLVLQFTGLSRYDCLVAGMLVFRSRYGWGWRGILTVRGLVRAGITDSE